MTVLGTSPFQTTVPGEMRRQDPSAIAKKLKLGATYNVVDLVVAARRSVYFFPLPTSRILVF